MQTVIKVAGFALLFLGLAHTAEAQTGPWATQGNSNCSDQFGSFDAFIPGMRGNGSCNRGGFVPNTNVIVVTNLNASGSGSLAAAVADANCPKVILFNVGGRIDLTNLGTPLRTGSNNQRCDNWSMVGASAPGNVVVTGAAGGTYGLAAVLQTRGSYWTIDHMTFTGGGSNDAINLGSNTGVDGNNTHGILMNSNLIWGADEIVQHYTDWGSPQFNTLLWQNYIGQGVDDFAGSVIFQNSARNAGGIRNFLNDGWARTPLTRADGTFWANNVMVNQGPNGTMRINPCTGSSPVQPFDQQFRVHVINNMWVSGAQGNITFPSDVPISHHGDSGSCTNPSWYEDGNLYMRNNNTIKDCSNHSCVENGGLKNSLTGSIIAATYPTGYVPEVIASSQQGMVAYATQLKDYVGSRPLDRLPLIAGRLENAINTIDGSGPQSPYVGRNNGASISTEGGYGAITPSNTNWTVTNQCGGMPTGAAANGIQSSGLTGLHEWVIGCFYDNVMTGGYREDKLQNYPAPGGGGSGPPPPPPPPQPTTPNPPEWGVG